MKKVFKVIAIVLGVIVVAFAGMITYVKLALPDVGPPEEMSVTSTPEMVERGRYLANHVMVCMDCHSTRDWSKFSGPPAEGTFGKGGERFDQTVGMPGVIYSKNITPASINRYTDGELYRLITTGVTKEGKPMFPLMPYPYYGKMDSEDIKSVIAYIRSLAPIENTVPNTELDFPLNIIVHTIPQKAQPQKRPAESDVIAYGAYMTNASGCVECHTQAEKGQIIHDVAFGGGREFQFPDGSIVRSSNITTHQSGISTWTEEMFVKRFKMYADSGYVVPSVAPGEFNSIMPWTMYAGMKEEDLKAIFAYLRTVKPIDNTVVKYTPATNKL